MMRWSRVVLMVVVAIGLRTAPSLAGPLPPCIRVTMSANASFLVLNDLTYDDPDETHVRKIKTSTFRVMHRSTELNDYLRVNGPDTYWSMDAIWSVSFDGKDGWSLACSYTLVTDDGEFLIFLDGSPVGGMTIYRRSYRPRFPGNWSNNDHGTMVRKVPLSELWEKQNIPEMMDDHTPFWFAGGDFKFSPDNRTLIHKTKWGATFQIDLATGVVKKS